MYYSYYKTIAESKTFFDGMNKLSRDNLSEYNNVIYATRKYSLLPEVIILDKTSSQFFIFEYNNRFYTILSIVQIIAGFLYHITKNLGLISYNKAQCWQVRLVKFLYETYSFYKILIKLIIFR